MAFPDIPIGLEATADLNWVYLIDKSDVLQANINSIYPALQCMTERRDLTLPNSSWIDMLNGKAPFNVNDNVLVSYYLGQYAYLDLKGASLGQGYEFYRPRNQEIAPYIDITPRERPDDHSIELSKYWPYEPYYLLWWRQVGSIWNEEAGKWEWQMGNVNGGTVPVTASQVWYGIRAWFNWLLQRHARIQFAKFVKLAMGYNNA